MGNQPSRASISTAEALLRSSSPEDARRGSAILSEICIGIIAGDPPPRGGRSLPWKLNLGKKRKKGKRGIDGKNDRERKGGSRRPRRRDDVGHRVNAANKAITQSEKQERDEVFGPMLSGRLSRLLRYLCRIVRGDRPEASAVDSVLASMDALDAVGRLFLHAQEKNVAHNAMIGMAAPLRKRALPCLITKFWDRDLRVAGGARIALETLVRIIAVQTSPWVSVVNASMSFRNSNTEHALKYLLVHLATLVHFIFYDAVVNADYRMERWTRRRTSELSASDRVSRMDSLNAPTDEMVTGRSSLDVQRMSDTKMSRGSFEVGDGSVEGYGSASLGRRQSNYSARVQDGKLYLVRDMEAAIHLYTALLGNGTTNNPRLRKLVADDLFMVFNSALDGSRAFSAGLDQKMYREVAVATLEDQGNLLYHAVLKVMFTETETGACVAQRNCSAHTAKVCTQFLSLLLREFPEVCFPRSGLFTGSCSRAVSSLMECVTQVSPSRRLDFLKAAYHGVRLLSSAIPSDPYEALNVVAMDPTNFESTIESCLRSLAFAATQFAKMEATLFREAASLGLDETLTAWLALTRIGQHGLLWAKGPTYCSAIAFLSQIARSAAKTSSASLLLSSDVGGTEASGSSGHQESATLTIPRDQPLDRTRRHLSRDEWNARLLDHFESCTDVMIREAGSVNVARDLYRTIVFEYARIIRPAAFKNEVTPFFTGSPRPSASANVEGEHHVDSLSFNTETEVSATSDDVGRVFHDRTPVSSLQYTKVPEGDALTWLLESCMSNDGLKIAAYRELAIDSLPSTMGFWFSTSLPPDEKKPKRRSSENETLGGAASSSPPLIPTAMLTTSRPKIVDQGLFLEFAVSLSLIVKMTWDEKEVEEDRKSALEWIANDVKNAKSHFLSRVYEESLVIADLRTRQDHGAQYPFKRKDSDPTSNIALKETSAMLSEMKMLRSEVAELRSSLMRMEQDGGRNLIRRFPSQRLHMKFPARRSQNVNLGDDSNYEAGPLRDGRSRRRGLRRLFRRDRR